MGVVFNAFLNVFKSFMQLVMLSSQTVFTGATF